jgi:putative ABC transport system substrate-binding protein
VGRGAAVRRRDVIALIAGAAIASPLTAHGQQSAVPRVGYVWIGPRGTDVSIAGLRQGFADKGYIVGRSLVLEERYANGKPELVPELIAELLALKVDVLTTPGAQITRAAQRATSSVPIVCVTGDPVGVGLVASLSRPGGNITGLSLLSGEYSVKWLELLKEVAPKMRRVAVLSNPENAGGGIQTKRLQRAAPALGLEVTVLSVRPSDIESSLALLGPGIDGVVITDDPLLEPLIPRLIGLTAEHRLPAIYAFSGSVQRGGLMSYSADFFELWRRAAGYVDLILKGARPGELPIEQTTEVTLSINLKTAKSLGLTIPTSLLARAGEVVE